jgi:hypothetical protein
MSETVLLDRALTPSMTNPRKRNQRRSSRYEPAGGNQNALIRYAVDAALVDVTISPALCAQPLACNHLRTRHTHSTGGETFIRRIAETDFLRRFCD